MKQQCRDITSLFDRFLDRDLPEETISMIEHHLEQCSACSSALQEEQDIISSFKLLPELECPENVLRKIEAAVPGGESRLSPSESLMHLFRPLRRRMILIGAAAAAILILMFGPPFTGQREPTQVQPVAVEYSQEDAQHARKTAKWSLVYAAQTMSTAEKDIVRGTLVEQIPSTVRRSIKNTTKNF